MNVKSSERWGNQGYCKGRRKRTLWCEVDKIALIAPKATINIVREYEIVKKGKVTLLNHINGILICPFTDCITNTNEPVKSKFHAICHTGPLMLRCYYCERIMTYQ